MANIKQGQSFDKCGLNQRTSAGGWWPLWGPLRYYRVFTQRTSLHTWSPQSNSPPVKTASSLMSECKSQTYRVTWCINSWDGEQHTMYFRIFVPCFLCARRTTNKSPKQSKTKKMKISSSNSLSMSAATFKDLTAENHHFRLSPHWGPHCVCV